MAFFKFRKSGDAPQAEAPTGRRAVGKNAAAAEAETIAALRRRAKHRLLGAVVLVLVAVIGFPLVFDTQPRPVAVQAPIIIPNRNTAPALSVPPPAPVQPIQPAQPASAPSPVVRPPAAAASVAPPPSAAPSNASSGPRNAPSANAPAPTASRPAASAADNAARAEQARKEREAKAAQQAKEREAQRKREQEAARAQALLEGRAPSSHAAHATPASKPGPATGKRYVIQIGAYAEAAGARAARQKAERAGVPTVEQEIKTPGGKRTRVRAGPFASREAAEQAAAKLKRAGLSASILAL